MRQTGPVARSVRWAVDRLVRLVWLAAALLDAVLVLDFVFRLIGSRDTGFVHAVYLVGSTVAGPFAGIFANMGHPGGLTLTWDDLVALGVYTVAALVLVRLIRVSRPRELRLV